VETAWRVSSTQVIPALLLTEDQQVDADGLTNTQKMLILGSRLSSPFICTSTEVHRGRGGQQQGFATEITDCLAMTHKSRDAVTFAPVGGDPVTLLRASRRDHLTAVPFNDPTRLRLVGPRLFAEVLADC
jgi:hypothetical protein